jgi:hypothetical protein
MTLSQSSMCKITNSTQESGSHSEDVQDGDDGEEDIWEPAYEHRIDIHGVTYVLTNFGECQIQK